MYGQHVTNKQLYFMHIPKAGGMSLMATLEPVLRASGLPYFMHRYTDDSCTDLNTCVFLQGHFGLYPLTKNSKFETAILLRDPLDRAVSNFAMLHRMNVLDKSAEYLSLETLEEKLKYYLFEDVLTTNHRNIQSRFMSTSGDYSILNIIFDPAANTHKQNEKAKAALQPSNYSKKARQWFLGDAPLNWESVKSTIDNASILGTTENHNGFVDKVIKWLQNNYPQHITTDLVPEHLTANTSGLAGHSTENLKALLSDDDKAKVYEYNYIDARAYRYVQQLLGE
jgi:Sulfotransferase family